MDRGGREAGDVRRGRAYAPDVASVSPSYDAGTSPPTLDVPALQRRTVRVLVTSQVVGGVGFASAVTVGGLLAEDISGSTTLSGLSGTMTVLGAALLALPIARLASSRGRRPGLLLGWGAGLLGAVLMVLAAVVRSFPLLLVGSLLFGGGSAAGLQSRFAATDLATASTRGRALSVVVWATTVGAVLGPNLTDPGAWVARRVDLPVLAGPLLFSVVSFTVAAVVVNLLRPDPLRVARGDRPGSARVPHPRLLASLAVVRRSPGAVLALTTVVVGHAVMVAVMTMTPLHMHHGGAELRVVGFVISGHIAGMFAFSPLVGWLADRVGRVPVIVLAQVLLLAAVTVAALGAHSTTALAGGLFLLGLGWSFGLVAGSTLLTESVPLEDRPGVQGGADFLMNLLGACAGALSGVLLHALGYSGLAGVAAVLTVPVLLLCLLGRRARAPRLPAPRG